MHYTLISQVRYCHHSNKGGTIAEKFAALEGNEVDFFIQDRRSRGTGVEVTRPSTGSGLLSFCVPWWETVSIPPRIESRLGYGEMGGSTSHGADVSNGSPSGATDLQKAARRGIAVLALE